MDVDTTMVAALSCVLLEEFHITVTVIQATGLPVTMLPVKVCSYLNSHVITFIGNVITCVGILLHVSVY